jgi:hypothetical protein
VQPVSSLLPTRTLDEVRFHSPVIKGSYLTKREAERRVRINDSRRAVEEAAELGAEVLSLRAGPAPDRDVDAARAMVMAGIEHL